MYCNDLSQILDSYISDELLVETNHDVLRHLDSCVDCRRDLAARRDLRLNLKHAVLDAAESRIDPVFASRLKNELRIDALRPNGVLAGFDLSRIFNARNLVLVFGCLLILGFGSLLVFDGTKSVARTANTKTASPMNSESDIAAAVRASWLKLTNQAVGDHENCAVKYNLKEDPISLDEAAKTYAAYYKGLDKVIETAAAKSIDAKDVAEFVESHMCIYDGRQFAHIVFKQHGKLVSVLVTNTDLPASTDGLMTSRYDADTNTAGMHFGHFAVFVVSNLTEAENSSLAQRVAPAVRLHAEKLRA